VVLGRGMGFPPSPMSRGPIDK